MDSGLYIARFRTPMDSNAGVIIVDGDKIRGGDSAYYYKGQVLSEDADKITVRLEVSAHTQAEFGVFGDINDFALDLVGKKKGSVYEFDGRAERVSSLRFTAVLEYID